MASARHSSEPRTFPSTGFALIDPSIPIEEEEIPNYKAHRYYPVNIGEVFNSRYQIICKLGYGASSTVWLSRDLEEDRYVVLKVFVNTSMTHRELPIYERLSRLQSKHPGQRYVRRLFDSFEIVGPHGRHICLVHQPLGMSLYELKQRTGRPVDKAILKVSIRQLLLALDFLHKEAHIIHTDVQPANLLFGVENESVFSDLEKKELESPSPRKQADDRTIYFSQLIPLTIGRPVLSDLGEARLGDEEHFEDIMPDVYRAPEVILGMEWSYQADIWAVAMTIWDLFEPRRIFHARNSKDKYDDSYHLAEMIAIMGPPPVDFLQRRPENTQVFWDENGNWRGIAPIPDISLERMESRLEGEEKSEFLEFIRLMLTWKPEERPAAGEVIYDPWLMEGLFE